MKRKIIEILKENQEWNSSLNNTADELIILFTTSQKQLLIEFFDYAKNEAGTYRLRDMNSERMVESYLKNK